MTCHVILAFFENGRHIRTVDTDEQLTQTNCRHRRTVDTDKLAIQTNSRDSMNIKTKALKVEVSHVKPPEGFNYEKRAFVISDSDIGCYSRPEIGNNVLIGSEDPERDERIYVDPDNWDTKFSEQWKAQVLRQAQRYPAEFHRSS